MNKNNGFAGNLLLVAVTGLVGILAAAAGCQKDGAAPASEPVGEVDAGAPGWSTPITAGNTGLAASDLHFEGAPDAIEGLTISRIVTDPEVQIRADAPCISCHDWAEGITREGFCARLDEFMTTDQDGCGPKPQLLKDVLADWGERGCPE